MNYRLGATGRSTAAGIGALLLVAAAAAGGSVASAAEPADFVGRWKVRMDGGGEVYFGELRLEPAGQASDLMLGGVYKSQGNSGRLRDARIKGRVLTVEFATRRNGTPVSVIFMAEQDGQMLKGDAEIIYGDGSRVYPFEASPVGGRSAHPAASREPAAAPQAEQEAPQAEKRVAATARPAAASAFKTLAFQNGVDGYTGAVDTEIWAIAPDKALDRQGTMTTDGNNGGGESQVLMRFDGVFGDRAKQAPLASEIRSAKLTVVVFDPGSTIYLHAIRSPWSASATWNKLHAGVSVDGVEAALRRDGFSFGAITMDKQLAEFDVTATVREWAAGLPNYGWVFVSTGGNGWDFYSSDWLDPQLRPRLEITFRPTDAGGAARLAANVDD